MALWQRWMVRSLFITTVGLGFILTFLAWLVQSLRLTLLLTHQTLDGWQVLVLCLGTLPRTAVIVLPLAFACAVGSVLGRNFHTREANAAFGLGASPWFLGAPVALSAVLLTVGLYALDTLTPASTRASRIQEHALRGSLDPAFLTPGVFLQVNQKIFYVHRQQARNVFQGIFIYDPTHKEKKLFLTGKTAILAPHNHGFSITLHQGTYHEISPRTPPFSVRFQTYTLIMLPKQTTSRTVHPQELSWHQLYRLIAHDKMVRDTRKKNVSSLADQDGKQQRDGITIGDHTVRPHHDKTAHAKHARIFAQDNHNTAAGPMPDQHLRHPVGWTQDLIHEFGQRTMLPAMSLVDGLWVSWFIVVTRAQWLGYVSSLLAVAGWHIFLPNSSWGLWGLAGALILNVTAWLITGLVTRTRRAHTQGLSAPSGIISP